jgi:hypothetical protein
MFVLFFGHIRSIKGGFTPLWPAYKSNCKNFGQNLSKKLLDLFYMILYSLVISNCIFFLEYFALLDWVILLSSKEIFFTFFTFSNLIYCFIFIWSFEISTKNFDTKIAFARLNKFRNSKPAESHTFNFHNIIRALWCA